jgi:DNA invertase Pin-like site-specific DNA recombinase
MSSWQGNANPGHRRRLALWHAIETEFDEPIRDVIQGLREQGNSWRTVAGALGVSLSTLQEWRKALNMQLNHADKVFDPSSLPRYTPTDCKARALGYEDAQDAVLEMRCKDQLTIKQVARILGIHYTTVTRYTPSELRGAIYNRSTRWWEIRRAQILLLTKQNQRNSSYIWRKINNAFWNEMKGQLPGAGAG